MGDFYKPIKRKQAKGQVTLRNRSLQEYPGNAVPKLKCKILCKYIVQIFQTIISVSSTIKDCRIFMDVMTS